MTLEDLSAEFGVSRERVRQIEVRAFEKVQNAVKAAYAKREVARPAAGLARVSSFVQASISSRRAQSSYFQASIAVSRARSPAIPFSNTSAPRR